ILSAAKDLRTPQPDPQGFSNHGSNNPIHVAAAPQLILLYMFVCILRALMRTQNTHKHVLQLVVAAGDPPVRDYYPYYLRSPGHTLGSHPVILGSLRSEQHQNAM